MLLFTAVAPTVVGCGTTRSTDTGRTATEQLLISDAVDRAVQTVDLKMLAGQKVYLDDSRLGEVVDRNYLISTLRQHVLASGCHLSDKREDAEFVVEARAGAVGTDRNDLLFGIPSTQVPQLSPLQPVPGGMIPEIPIAKRRDQKGIAKIAVFAYHRETGTPVWQSGLVHQESSANDVWILGAGPFQRGSIYDGTAFAGKTIGNEDDEDVPEPRRLPAVSLADESTFTKPEQLTKREEPAAKPEADEESAPAVAQASHQEPQPAPPAPEAAPIDPAAGAQTAPAAPTTAAPPTTPAATAPAASSPQASAPAVTAPPAAISPATPSVYAPAGTTQLPQPRFDSR